MNPLLKKEIRLLLPAWLAVMFLEMGLPWVGADRRDNIAYAPYFFFFGMVLLAVDSFGREFNLGTFSSLMSQPLERQKIWRSKLSVLLAAAGLVFISYFVSCDLRFHLSSVEGHAVWLTGKALLQHDFTVAMVVSGVVLMVAVTGGMWAALLLRQISSAFWIALVVPAGLFVLALSLQIQFTAWSAGLIVIYILASFLLARRLFFHAQDAGWGGGGISFSKWRYFECRAGQKISRRQPQPFVALVKKEMSLHSVTLLAALAVLGLHVGVLVMRGFYVDARDASVTDIVSQCFWVLWLVFPLVIGCTAVAEERKLAITAGQFSLPVSRRFQFSIKLIISLLLGVVLGGVVPVVMETLARRLGLGNETFQAANPWIIVALAGIVAGAGLFASTLARNFLEALGVGIFMIVGGCLTVPTLQTIRQHFDVTLQQMVLFGVIPDSWGLLLLIGAPTVVVVLPWLAYYNFCHFQETSRFWRRTVVVLIGSLLFIVAASAAIYQRPWELVQPTEPARGMAKFSLANPPVLQGSFPGSFQVQLPGGRVWCDSLGYGFANDNPTFLSTVWVTLAHPLPANTGPAAFMGGSNWVSTASRRVDFWTTSPNGAGKSVRMTGYDDTVGIRSDGTLWISSEAESRAWTGETMVQFGSETNSRQVARMQSAYLLLRADGTLWQWGTNDSTAAWNQAPAHWPTVRGMQPRQIGTASDWREIGSAWVDAYARKTDGTAWTLDVQKTNTLATVLRQTNLDQIVPQTLVKTSNDQLAYVAHDGTLWLAARQPNENGSHWPQEPFHRVGTDSNWVNVAITGNFLVALRTDGSLWKRSLSAARASGEPTEQSLVRLGTHQDWLALTGEWVGVVALAADGSLWYWPNPALEQITWLRLPRQPELIGNVFAKN